MVVFIDEFERALKLILK